MCKAWCHFTASCASHMVWQVLQIACMARRHVRADSELAGRSGAEDEGDTESLHACKAYLAEHKERCAKEMAAINQARAVCAERGSTGG